MGKIAADRAVDTLQLLNVALQDHKKKFKDSPLNQIDGIFISEERDTPGKLLVRSLEGPIATFSLQEMPGCCGVLVSYWSEIIPDYRKKGIGTELLTIRMATARAMKYGLLFATVDQSNKVETKLLLDAGWNKLREFRNPRTNNIIEVYSVNL